MSATLQLVFGFHCGTKQLESISCKKPLVTGLETIDVKHHLQDEKKG